MGSNGAKDDFVWVAECYIVLVKYGQVTNKMSLLQVT